MIGRLRNVDEELAKRVANGLGITLPAKLPPVKNPIDMVPSPALSIQKKMKMTLKGRRVGVLFGEGSDGREIEHVRAQVEQEGGTVFLVATKLHGTQLKDENVLKADGQLSGSPSVLFDAVAVVLAERGTIALLKDSAAIQFVADAFAHLKAVGHTTAALPLLQKAGVVTDEGVTELGPAFIAAAAKRFWEREPRGA